MYLSTTDDDVRLTRYRLQIVERMPDSPRKVVLVEALQRRLRQLCPSTEEGHPDSAPTSWAA